MIPEYISRKLHDFTTAPTNRDRLRALYDIAVQSPVLKRERLHEVSDRYGFEEHEEVEILEWAKAQI
ncbi:MAG: hypothetical protein ACRC62_30060 [Microcoleus sp.]